MPPLSTLNFLQCPPFGPKTECGQNTLKSLKTVFQTLLKNWSGLKIFTARPFPRVKKNLPPFLDTSKLLCSPLRANKFDLPPVECRPHLVNNEASLNSATWWFGGFCIIKMSVKSLPPVLGLFGLKLVIGHNVIIWHPLCNVHIHM